MTMFGMANATMDVSRGFELEHPGKSFAWLGADAAPRDIRMPEALTRIDDRSRGSICQEPAILVLGCLADGARKDTG